MALVLFSVQVNDYVDESANNVFQALVKGVVSSVSLIGSGWKE